MKSSCYRILLLAAAAGIIPLALPAQQSSPDSTTSIRVATHLVQIGVIVHEGAQVDKKLTKDDFTILDRGKPQEISVFSMDSADSAAAASSPPQPLPQNIFSDLPQFTSSAAGSITIVLLDNLNTLYGSAPIPYESSPNWMEDHALANAKSHLIEFIGNLDPRDRVAIYSLRDSLRVMCDFTNDRAELLSVLQKYDTSSKTSREIVEPGSTHIPATSRHFNSTIDKGRLDLAANANDDRAATTMAALEAIAAHVENIPGRKNLVWLTANLPFSANAIAGVLSRAQIAAYPIDARGLLARGPSAESVSGTMDADELNRAPSLPAQSARPIGIDTMLKLADLTGGEAFINTNDITNAIRKAVSDSAVIYTLGFYVDPDSLDGKFHEIKIQMKQRGLTIRYPKGYFAISEDPASGDDIRANLFTAVRSPIESSAVPLQARIERLNQPVPNSLNVFGFIDANKLRFRKIGENEIGAIVVSVVQQDAAGRILSQSVDKFKLRLGPVEYADDLKSGVRFHQAIEPKSGAITLRVVVEDAATAQVGSLIIPIADIK